MKKFERKDKNEKRRLAFEKRNVKKEMNLARYGAEGGAALVMAKTGVLNRRFVAVFLVLVFAISCLVVGVNITSKAAQPDQVIADGTYTKTVDGIDYTSSYYYDGTIGSATKSVTRKPSYAITVTVSEGLISALSATCTNTYPTSETQYGTFDSNATKATALAKRQWNNTVSDSIGCFLNGSNDSAYSVSAIEQLVGQPATYNDVAKLSMENKSTINNPADGYQFIQLKNALLSTVEKAPAAPADIIDIDDDEEYIPELPESVENSLELNKVLNRASNGTDYDVTLEAYSTANLGTQNVKEKTPTDFVIIVDQSGSMTYSDMASKYVAAGNNLTIEDIANGNYYYNDGTGTYRVFATRGPLYKYYESETFHLGNMFDSSYYGWFQDKDVNLNLANMYYVKLKDPDNVTLATASENGVFLPLRINIDAAALHYEDRFYYTYNGIEHQIERIGHPSYYFLGIKNPYSNGNNPAYWVAEEAISAIWPGSDDSYTFAKVRGAMTGHYVNFDLYKRKIGYTKLCYRDNDGVLHTLESDSGLTDITYCNESSQALTTADGNTRVTYSNLLKATSNETRLKTLNTALKDFAKALQAERDSFGTVDNKVAIVGFSSDGYSNNELLTGVELTVPTWYNSSEWSDSSSSPYSLDGKPHNGTQYSTSLSNDVYANTLLSATNEHDDIIKAINAVTAYGGTQPEYGFEMAEKILLNRKDTTFTKKIGVHRGTQQPRNQIVIFFTDGEPGDRDDDNRYVEANDVVKEAKDIKDLGATVYSIGVFGNSDGEPIKYPSHIVDSAYDYYQYEDGFFEVKRDGSYYYLNRYWLDSKEDTYGSEPSDTIYDYMSVVSSNYPDATGFISDAWAENGTDANYDDWLDMIHKVRDPNDKNPSNQNNYYRMASNQASLISAFREAITDQQPESSTVEGQISEETALKDVIDTDNFDIPKNNNGVPTAPVEITFVKGHKETSGENEGDITFSDVLTLQQFNQQFGTSIEPLWTTDANGKNVLVVDGFNYNDYYIAQGKDGYKMVVKIGGLTPKATATGKSIASNKNTSAMYKDASADAELLKDFPVPTITRHKYDLFVGDDNPEATFLLSTQIVDENNNPVAKDNAALKDVIITNSSGQRLLYSASSDAGGTSDASAGTGTALYYEQLPEGYKVKTSITTSDNTFTYDLLLDSETEEAKRTLEVGTPTTENLSYDNHTLRISSSPNSRILTLHLDADESPFVDNGYKFAVDVSWTDSEGTHSTPVTMIYNNGTIQDATVSIPYGATNITVSHSDYFYDTSIENGGSTYSISGPFETDQTVSIVDTAKEEIGTGVSEGSNPTKTLLYGLATVFVLSSGAGAAYVYRRKDEFLER